MLDQITVSNLQPIGCGQSCAVYSDGRYAIKFGVVHQEDVAVLTELADLGLAPDIHYYERRVKLSETLYTLLLSLPVDYYGDDRSIETYSYVNGSYDVLIMDIVTPLTNVSHRKPMKEARKKMWRITKRLSEKVASLGLLWEDDHIGNVGIIGRKAVVLDW